MVEEKLLEQDAAYDLQLRPQTLCDFIGHDALKKRLHILLTAAKQRTDPLGHLLFYGPPGLGKTTLANILGKEMGSQVYVTSGPTLEKAGDLAGLVTNLERGDILFIDEIHRLHPSIEEYLYPALENFSLDLMLDSGPNARSVQVQLKPFCLIGATTKLGNLSSPLRSRFENTLRLDYYDEKALAQIVMRSAQILNVAIDMPSAELIGARSRGTPRLANNLLRWIRDYAQLHNESRIDTHTVEKACALAEIDAHGLDHMDKKILGLIYHEYDGGPVGLKALAASLGEEETTLSDVYEPYLITRGFLKRTPRGRSITKQTLRMLEEKSL